MESGLSLSYHTLTLFNILLKRFWINLKTNFIKVLLRMNQDLFLELEPIKSRQKRLRTWFIFTPVLQHFYCTESVNKTDFHWLVVGF